MKFIVTDYWKCEWRCADHYDLGKDRDGNVNNVLVVEPVTNVDDGDISADAVDNNVVIVEPITNVDDDEEESSNEAINEANINRVIEKTPVIVVESEVNTEQIREAFEKIHFSSNSIQNISINLFN